MSFFFTPAPRPFHLWLGPFVAARGRTTDFRVRGEEFGAVVRSQEGERFWPAIETRGLKMMTGLVKDNWRGGRVLLLPDGHVVKPLQEEEERGLRVLIGRYSGSFALRMPGEGQFDLSPSATHRVGRPWGGPASVGIECAIHDDGSLHCKWWQRHGGGLFEVNSQVCGPDPALAQGFRAARPGAEGGRVRVTVSGHVITNRETSPKNWTSLYVGRIDPRNWTHDQSWIGAKHA
jgi:hypothetical protein